MCSTSDSTVSQSFVISTKIRAFSVLNVAHLELQSQLTEFNASQRFTHQRTMAKEHKQYPGNTLSSKTKNKENV